MLEEVRQGQLLLEQHYREASETQLASARTALMEQRTQELAVVADMLSDKLTQELASMRYEEATKTGRDMFARHHDRSTLIVDIFG